MSKDKDPNEGLADDATLATDIKDEDARKAEQLEYYGGDKDDLDDEDFTEADRGDALADDDADEDRGDEVDNDGEKEKDNESEDEDDEAGEEDDADDADADAEDEDADDGDQDDSAEDDSEDDTVEDEDESEADDAANKGIPRRRFNEVNERMKAAEAKVAAIEAEKEAEDKGEEETYDFDTAEDEYMELLLDGKTKEAGAKRREIRAAEKADFTADAKKETIQEVDNDAMQTLVDSLAVQAEDMFPEFNPKSEDYRPALVSKVSTFMRGYQTNGVKADEALVSAIADVAEMYGLATGSEDTESEDKGDDVEDDKPTKKKGKPVRKIKEKIKLAEKQGKSPAGEGKGSSEAGAVVPDVEQMTDEEIDALPPETLARIRGDFVE